MSVAVRQWCAFGAMLAVVGIAPYGWAVPLAIWGPRVGDVRSSYLPSLEAERPRRAFDRDVPADLARLAPDVVLIGDSMAGRVDVDRLTALSGGIVGPLLQPASGSAFWYLALKNFVAASGVRPRWVFIFFRDTNLTDVMFRIDGPYRENLDRAAHDEEPELDAVVAAATGGSFSRVHRWLDRTYHVSQVRQWLDPVLTAWPAAWLTRDPHAREQLLTRVNDAFALDRLRPMAQADLEAADRQQSDFAARIDQSVLPAMVNLARAHGLRLGFVRVMRRPVNGQPPPQPPELRAYIAALRAYLASHGAVLFDDNDDPAFATLPYEDGDHLDASAAVPYTELFWSRLAQTSP